MKELLRFALFFLFAGSLASCVSHKDLLVLNEGNVEEVLEKSASALRIQKDDLLSVYISSSVAQNPELIAPYNPGGEEPFSYLVGEDGTIELPQVGILSVEGKTLGEARNMIRDRCREYLEEPVVVMKLENFKVTILGEVNSPGTYRLESEQLNIFQLIGLAGDLTPYGDRTGVLVVRQNKFASPDIQLINLQDKNTLISPYYVLQQNDLVVIQPVSQKTATIADPTAKILPYVGLIASALNLVLILTRL